MGFLQGRNGVSELAFAEAERSQRMMGVEALRCLQDSSAQSSLLFGVGHTGLLPPRTQRARIVGERLARTEVHIRPMPARSRPVRNSCHGEIRLVAELQSI